MGNWILGVRIANSPSESCQSRCGRSLERVTGAPTGERLRSFCTQDDEDVARVKLRQALYPERPPERTPRGEAYRPSGGGLSDDGRFVRDITNVLRQRGIPESSAWRLVNRERPGWTRERWDAARAELQGGAATATVRESGVSGALGLG